ncbi:MAG TPA: DUF2784 domain-containing protein [Thermoanaerobaculia bacterium]|nr:DUF2784 domain-containing protein [Thermoanaerobaculia bacterium]
MAFLASAKLVALAHFSFVAFVFLGALLFTSYPWLAWVHGACILYAILISIVGWSCPLTLLEQWLLSLAGAAPYSGEFLPHYVWSRFGLTGNELPVVASLVLAILGANAFQYWALFRTK